MTAVLPLDQQPEVQRALVLSNQGLASLRQGNILEAERLLAEASELAPVSPFTDRYHQLRMVHHREVPKRLKLLVYGTPDPGQWAPYWKTAADPLFPGTRATRDAITDMVPQDWAPDACVVMLPEISGNTLPPDLADCPIPTVACVLDRNNFGSSFYAKLPLFDLILTSDHESVRIFRAMGHANVAYVPLCGFEPLYIRRVDEPKTYDVTFFGGLGYSGRHPGYRLRDLFAQQVLGLRHRFKVRIATHQSIGDTQLFGPNYLRALNQTRIGINCVATDNMHLNPSLLEIMQCGTLAFAYRHDPVIQESFRDGEEIVLYDEHDLEDKLAYYLGQPEEAARIAKAGQQAVQAHRHLLHFRQMVPLIDRRTRLRARPILLLPGLEQSLALAAAAFQCRHYGHARAVWVQHAQVALCQNNLGVAVASAYLLEPKPQHREAALNHFDQALQLDPQLIWALFNRMLAKHLIFKESVQADAERLLHAIDDREAPVFPPHAVTVTPLFASPMHLSLFHNELGYALCPPDEDRLRRFLRWQALKAIAETTGNPVAYRKALQSMPHDPEIRLALAQGPIPHDEALAVIEEGLTFCPLESPLQLQHFKLLLAAGRKDDAQHLLEDWEAGLIMKETVLQEARSLLVDSD